jgi:recombinational DNA repair protein (RecF pathway)
MPISLVQYLAEAGERDKANIDMQKCVDCGTPLQETIAGYRPTKDGAKCSDCYFDTISAMIDEHPIGRPVAIHGAH